MRRDALLMMAGWALFVAAAGAAGSAPSQTRSDTVVARLDLTIGEGSPASPHLFTRISGVAVDDQGRIYVVDTRAQQFVVFAPDGKPIATAGRHGQGPGEFEFPHGLSFAPDGSLYVRAVNGVSRFVFDSSTGATTRFDRRFTGPRFPDWTNPRAARIDGEARLYHPHPVARGGVQRHVYIRYSRDGATVDTLWVPLYANMPAQSASYPTGPQSGRLLHGLNFVPFAPIPVWDVTPRGTIISGDAMSYTLVETDASGNVVRRIGRDGPLTRVPNGERADSARALRQRLDSIPVAITRVRGMPTEVRDARLPTVYPAYLALFVASDDRIWVQRWPPANRGQETFFDVFDPDGGFRATVVLPVRLILPHHPAITPDAIHGVIRDPETDIESVVRLRYTIGR
jgi:hypothetical protein